MDHEQLLGLDLVLAAELGDGAARGVHVRLRLDQYNLALAALFLGIVDVDERDLGASLVFPVRDTGLTGQLVDRLKAGVVAGLGIFLARVAKSGNHANLKRLCSCHMLPFVDLSSAMVSDPVAAVKWRAIRLVEGVWAVAGSWGGQLVQICINREAIGCEKWICGAVLVLYGHVLRYLVPFRAFK